jgi:hypothetical protein
MLRQITFKIDKDNLQDYESSMDSVGDYPLYASTCGISRCEAVAIDKILQLGLGNETEVEISVKYL